jgi:hypothetical protein
MAPAHRSDSFPRATPPRGSADTGPSAEAGGRGGAAPAPVLDAETVASLVADATLAPSMHNAQPWKFAFDERSRTFALRADTSRGMPQADPEGRALHLGCAAALFNLRVAAVNAGWETVTRLLPDSSDPQLLAELVLAQPREAYDELAGLYPAIRRRHSSRVPFRAERIEEPLLDVLRRAALLEGARLVIPGELHRQTILDLAREADLLDLEDPAYQAEMAQWVGDRDGPREAGGGGAGAKERDFGIPGYALGPRPRSGGAPMRDFGAAADTGRAVEKGAPGRTARREYADFEESPQLALLGTVHDRPADWMRAGQALERVLLEATLDGLVTSVASQALERSELRWAARDPEYAMGHVHMVIRLGYGPEGLSTRRRPVTDVLSAGPSAE